MAVPGGTLRFRWPRTNRLTRAQDIRLTIRRGRRYSTGWYRFFFLPQETQSVKFAFSVRKKVGSAVRRNRIRRQLKEAVRINRTNWPARGYGVFVVDRPPVDHEQSQLRPELEKILKKTRQLNIS